MRFLRKCFWSAEIHFRFLAFGFEFPGEGCRETKSGDESPHSKKGVAIGVRGTAAPAAPRRIRRSARLRSFSTRIMAFFRFSLRTALGFMGVVALGCAVLFAVPEYVRLSVLFVGVLMMPGPLAVMARSGSAPARAFCLAGLVSYAAWFVLIGIPSGFFVVQQFGQYVAVPLTQYGTGLKGLATIVLPTYLVYAGLYAPWIVVPLSGACSLLGHIVCETGRRPQVNSARELR
jgi:hypothetical protein